MIKVIHILSDMNIGGAGTLLVNYLKNFDKSRFIIKIILPEGSLLTPRITALGYEVIEIEGLMDKSLDLSAIGKLKKIFKEIYAAGFSFETSPYIFELYKKLFSNSGNCSKI